MSSKRKISSFRQLAATLMWLVLIALVGLLVTKSHFSAKQGVVSEVLYLLDDHQDGSDLVTIEEIQERILDEYNFDLVGAEIDRLDLNRIEKILDDEPFITKSHAYIDRKNRLHVTLEQRVPMMRILDQNGNNFYLDDAGVRLPLSDHFAARVPVVTGHVPKYQDGAWAEHQTALHDAHRLIALSLNDPFMHAWLESINIDRHGELQLYGNVGRFAVDFGHAENMDVKIQSLKQFLKAGADNIAWNSLESISLKFDGQIITRKKSNA